LSPVALTFDDGPDADWTPQVLEALANAGIPATFFVVAEQIAEPGGSELLWTIMDAGHSVQPHCARHIRHTELELEALRNDVAQVLGALVDHGVSKPKFWRPPYGVLHPQHSPRVAAEVDLQLKLWTHDPRDHAGTTREEMLTSLGSLDEDSVILLHDSRRYSHATDSAANTVALIEPLVALIRDRGYQAAPLS
jgi:peptidoglycan/xylan/chitin deacetylase (PgdA/CDA1 family)